MLSVGEEGISESIVDRVPEAVMGEEAVLEGLLVPYSIRFEELLRKVGAHSTV